MNIILTGATGFIGKHLTTKLIERGNQVSVICRPFSNIPAYMQEHCKVITYTPNNLDKFKEDVKSTQANHVVHLATLFLSNHKTKDIADLVEANITFGTHLLEAISELDIKRFINTTTYATSINGKEYMPQNLYAATKKAFEDILYFYSLDRNYFVLNLSLYDNYGPHDTRPKLINLILNSAQKGETLNMSPGEQEICYTYVDDTVVGIEQGLKMNLDSLWNNYSIYANEVCTLKELALKVGQIMDREIKLNLGFYRYRAREIMKFSPLHPLLPGFKANISLKEGIQNIIKENQ